MRPIVRVGTGISIFLVLLGLPADVAAQPAKPAERVDYLRSFAKRQLAGPGVDSAYPCDDAWSAGPEGTVVDLAGWLEAAGLRRGDRFVDIGGVLVADAGDWRLALRRARVADRLDLTVDRQGRLLTLRVACRSNTDRWRAHRGALEAMAEGRWDDCVSYGRRQIALVGRPFSAALRTQIECRRAAFTERRQPAPAEYWTRASRLYDQAD